MHFAWQDEVGLIARIFRRTRRADSRKVIAQMRGAQRFSQLIGKAAMAGPGCGAGAGVRHFINLSTSAPGVRVGNASTVRGPCSLRQLVTTVDVSPCISLVFLTAAALQKFRGRDILQVATVDVY